MSTAVTWQPRRDITDTTFVGITASVVDSLTWEENGTDLTVVFADELDTLTIIFVKLYMQARDDAEIFYLTEMFHHRNDNDAYAGIVTPTTAEVTAQVHALSQQFTTVMALVMQDLASLEPVFP